MVMSAIYFTQKVASTYNSSAYDTSNYGGSTTQSSTSSTAPGGVLTNTGIALAGIVTLAAVVLLVAIVVRVWRRPTKKADRTLKS